MLVFCAGAVTTAVLICMFVLLKIASDLESLKKRFDSVVRDYPSPGIATSMERPRD